MPISRRSTLALLSSPMWAGAVGAQSGASSAPNLPPGSPALLDGGDPATGRLKGVLNDLRGARPSAGITPSLNIVQMGDSHTSADFFTGRIRRRLQTAFGLGATGWIAPMPLPGQGHGLIRYDVQGWALTDSRFAESPDFPMAGVIAKPQQRGATLRVAYLYPPANAEVANQPLTMRLLLKREPDQPDSLRATTAVGSVPISIPGDGRWQWLDVRLPMPFTLTADNPGQCAMGGIWLQERPGGVSVSPVGVNSVVQAQWSKWKHGWALRDLSPGRPDLIILAYGTNEVLSDWLTMNGMREALTEGVRVLRREVPSAAVMLMTAPDTLAAAAKAGGGGACGGRALARYEGVLAVQNEVARSERTLLWNWQTAMGGPCSRAAWEAVEYAAKDGVHLQIKGYEASADRFVNDLFAWAGAPAVPLPPERA